MSDFESTTLSMQTLKNCGDVTCSEQRAPNIRPDAKTVAAKKAEIDAHYAWDARNRRAKRSKFHKLANLRLRELELLFWHRWGRQLPDDEAGSDDLVVAFIHVRVVAQNPDAAIRGWAATWAPWCVANELRDLMEQAFNERLPMADELGKRLGLSDAERTLLGIKTIGAFDVLKEARAARRAQKDRERKAQRRLAAGVTPRHRSNAKRKPWELLGMGRSTWYELNLHRGEGETARTISSAIDIDITADETVRHAQSIADVRGKCLRRAG
ncbi:hypothetical protein [Bradyrhizobium sp. USDA 4471]